MEIIKNAFEEGRFTETEWPNSTAKQNQIKIDVALENVSMMTRRNSMAVIPLHKICPETGDILETFPSRIAAARHIVNVILNRPEKNPFAVTGNLEICMRSGWKAYGFYWKIADAKYATKKGIPTSNEVFYKSATQELTFDSQRDAAQHFGVSPKHLGRVLNNKIGASRDFLQGAILQRVNQTHNTIHASNKTELATILQCSMPTLRKIIDTKSECTINNTTYKLKDTQMKSRAIKNVPGFKAVGYDLFDGKTKVGSYPNYKELAAANSLDRPTTHKRMLAGRPLDKAGNLTVKVRYTKI